MKTEPMSSPAILQAVADYHKQRAILVAELAKHTQGFLDNIPKRTEPIVAAMAIIDAKIERLCLRIA